MCKYFYQEKNRKLQLRDYYLVYTVLFAIMALIVFGSFWFNGKSFIWREDGINQHYNALVYYGEWGRSILRSLIQDHVWNVPLYDYNIGYGSDILTTLNYYVIGDPLDLATFFVPAKCTEYLYCALIILRLYLSGAAFSAYCFVMKQRRVATLAGAFCFVFCGYAVYAAVRHPYFTNPMIYLPLLMIGAERILRYQQEKWAGNLRTAAERGSNPLELIPVGGRRGPILFTLMVFVSAISNFYFFYILVFGIVVYVIARFFTMQHAHVGRELVITIIRFLIYGIIGVMMAAILLYPVAMLLFGTSRANVEILYHPLYHWTYYQKFIASFLTSTTGDFWARVAFPAPAILGLVLLFSEKGKRWVEKILFLGLTVLFLFPFFGSALNGFSYVTNRWCFLYAMLVAFLLVREWEILIHPDRRQLKWLLAGAVIYFVVLLVIDQGVVENTYASFTILLLALLMLLAVRVYRKGSGESLKTKRMVSLGMLLLLLVNIYVDAHYSYAYKEGHYISQFIDSGSLYDKVTTTGATAVKNVMEEEEETPDFGRLEQEFADTYPILNTPSLNGVSSTQFYWSLAKGNITQYLQEMSVSGTKWSYDYRNLDKRTMLTELAGVKYFVAEDEQVDPPFGYTLYDEIITNEKELKRIRKFYRKELGVKKLTVEQYDMIENRYGKKFYVYVNERPMPLGYTYTSYLTEDVFEEMNAAERQEALLQGVLLSDADIENLEINVSDVELDLTGESRKYELEPGDNVVIDEETGVITVGAAKSKVTLTFKGMKNSEYYLWAAGVHAQFNSQLEMFTDDNGEIAPLTVYNQMTKFQQNVLRYKDSKASDWTQNQYKFKVSLKNGRDASFTYSSPYYKWNSGQEDFLVNLGYYRGAKNTITITFPYAGTYSMDDLQVICQPMRTYPHRANKLRLNSLEHVQMGTNTVTGDITVYDDKILCMTIPYDEGWTAFVDGVETDLMQANTMYMALPLEKGTHHIELRYCTVGLKEGAMITAAGFILFILLICIHRKQWKRYCSEK